MTVAAPYLLLTKGKVYFEVENVGGQNKFCAGFAGANWARGPAGDDFDCCVGCDKEGQSWSLYGSGSFVHR